MNHYAETTTRPTLAILRVLNHVPAVPNEVYDWTTTAMVPCEYHEVPQHWNGALELIGISKNAFSAWTAFKIIDHPVKALIGAQVRMTTQVFNQWLEAHEFQRGNQIIGDFVLGPTRLLAESPYVEPRN